MRAVASVLALAATSLLAAACGGGGWPRRWFAATRHGLEAGPHLGEHHERPLSHVVDQVDRAKTLPDIVPRVREWSS